MPVLSPPRPMKPTARIPLRRVRAAWRDDPEVALMLRVKRGDGAAFAELAERYGPRVFGFFCRQLGDRNEAEDLAQEVFLRLFRYRRRYQPRARFATWVFHVAQNVARNALRSHRRHPAIRLDPGAEEDGRLMESLLSDRADAPWKPLERAETATVVRSAVAELAARQRAAVELHQFGDCSYAEVAAELDMSPKAAKSLLYRARNQLRDLLTPFMK
jgi:RNA polymerase sigma-70 factor, ECF subfamily